MIWNAEPRNCRHCCRIHCSNQNLHDTSSWCKITHVFLPNRCCSLSINCAVSAERPDSVSRLAEAVGENIVTLQLPTKHHLAISIDTMDLKNRLRDIETNCLIACMFSSSGSWELQHHPQLWHLRAGGGAVHSIRRRHLEAPSAVGHWQARIAARCASHRGRSLFSSPEPRCRLSIRAFALTRSVVSKPSVNRL
jgi:hypothetical protein